MDREECFPSGSVGGAGNTHSSVGGAGGGEVDGVRSGLC